jgi:uncharacterized SAM-dependent methyltransferase
MCRSFSINREQFILMLTKMKQKKHGRKLCSFKGETYGKLIEHLEVKHLSTLRCRRL